MNEGKGGLKEAVWEVRQEGGTQSSPKFCVGLHIHWQRVLLKPLEYQWLNLLTTSCWGLVWKYFRNPRELESPPA